jgi:hypothetical protein
MEARDDRIWQRSRSSVERMKPAVSGEVEQLRNNATTTCDIKSEAFLKTINAVLTAAASVRLPVADLDLISSHHRLYPGVVTFRTAIGVTLALFPVQSRVGIA